MSITDSHFPAPPVGKRSLTRLALAAARSVSEAKDVPFNPLFLYGGVGLGKAHCACMLVLMSFKVEVHCEGSCLYVR